jgi:hypothetical protein
MDRLGKLGGAAKWVGGVLAVLLLMTLLLLANVAWYHWMGALEKTLGWAG